MDELVSLIEPEPWSRFTAGLVATMAVARGLDFLSTWLVTPRLALEANPLMRRLRWGWMGLLNLTKRGKVDWPSDVLAGNYQIARLSWGNLR